ncbi:endonuclease-reverse transcriptase [Plakobranchus ocellatus]|uniref:Endonuclease-reverse transcriptase n=1 Tax=Plakobranchus ocellatus TaxID=259542 RepID=A0AAV3Y088_9GAST|nr:endonuclease-reverse transcriptase [Plakobranchus ocellatus]
MKLYNINANLIRIIESLYNKAASAVYFKNDRAGVCQGCLISPILFNIFLERIMTDTLEDHEGTVSIGGISSDIRISGQKVETVNEFKYLGAMVADEGSKPGILSRMAQTTEY